MAIRGVIFDLGATLLHLPPVDGAALARACDAHLHAFLRGLGLPPTQADAVLAHAGEQLGHRRRTRSHAQFTLESNLERALRRAGVRLAPRLVGAAALAWWQPEFGLWQRADGVDLVLRAARAGGLRAGLCSNTASHAYTVHLVALHGLADRLDPVVTSAAVGWRKPDPRALLPLLRAWNLPPHEVAMVGDDLGCDVAGAAAVGMPSVWVRRYSRSSAAAYGGPAPTHTATCLEDVPVLLGL